MSKKVAIDVKTLALCAIILVGLILAIVGLFGDFLKNASLSDISDTNDLRKAVGGDPIKGSIPTIIFAWATFAFAILSTLCFAAVKFLGVKGADKIILLLGVLTVVCAILVFVFTLVMKGDDGKLGAGSILMLIGGLLVGGGAVASEKL